MTIYVELMSLFTFNNDLAKKKKANQGHYKPQTERKSSKVSKKRPHEQNNEGPNFREETTKTTPSVCKPNN